MPRCCVRCGSLNISVSAPVIKLSSFGVWSVPETRCQDCGLVYIDMETVKLDIAADKKNKESTHA